MTLAPRRTAMTPADEGVRIGPPTLFDTPDTVASALVSCTFTWDLPEAQRLVRAWGLVADTELGGPAVPGNTCATFTPGQFVRPGAVFTSRGCPHRCPWCFVPEREGRLRPLPVVPAGNNILDNNLLACPPSHLAAVWAMLGTQHRVELTGGLQAERVTDRTVEALAGVWIRQLFVAMDHESKERATARAIQRLRRVFSRRQVRVYVLVGHAPQETVAQAEARLVRAWAFGGLPFAMLYRGLDGRPARTEPAWRTLIKTWTRPAATVSRAAELGLAPR